MEDEKNIVALEKCCLCGKETGGILLDQLLNRGFSEKFASTPNSFCDKCKKDYLSIGTMFFTKSGKIIVLKDDAVRKIFKKEPPKYKVAMIPESVMESLINHNN